ncbi:MAG: hypothetical protein MJ240_01795, partial [Kiritimatiellae bacterium]|nr:hypothetical protein [Kiritimatiellia bacterium]
MTSDVGVTPVGVSVGTPGDADRTMLSVGAQPSPEVIARFQAAMQKPLADNAVLQQSLETLVAAQVPSAVIAEKPTELPAMPPVAQPVVAEKVVTAAAQPAVVPESRPVQLPVATPETFKAIVTENQVAAQVFATVIAEKPVELPVTLPNAQPVVGERPMVAEKVVTVEAVAQSAVVPESRPVQLPVATPETF